MTHDCGYDVRFGSESTDMGSGSPDLGTERPD